MATIDSGGLRGVTRVDPAERTELSTGPRQAILARLQRISLAMRSDQGGASAAAAAAAAPVVAAGAEMLPAARLAPEAESAPLSARVALQAALPAIDELKSVAAASPAIPRPALAAGDMATLSAVGRWVDAIVRMAPTVPQFQIGTGRVLLSSNLRTDTSTLAGVLQRTVETTGLFYESHLAEWARGERFLENLQLEPQFDWQSPPATVPGRAPEGPPLEQVGLLAQQLNALDQQRISWTGEAWPGQPLSWQVAQDHADPDSAAPGQASGGAWRTVLRLELPALGVVTAVVRLDGHNVGVTLTADRDSTAAKLRARGSELVDGLTAAGISTTGLNVERHEPD